MLGGESNLFGNNDLVLFSISLNLDETYAIKSWNHLVPKLDMTLGIEFAKYCQITIQYSFPPT